MKIFNWTVVGVASIAFMAGAVVGDFSKAVASGGEATDLSKRKFMVSIDEIKQSFVFADEFAGSYSRTVTMSDGSIRKIELTPMIHKGMHVVAFKDTGGLTYMGLNGTTTNGKLMVQVRDVNEMHRQLKEQGWPPIK